MKDETLAIHAGFKSDPTSNAVSTPIYQTVAYEFESAQHGADLFNLEVEGNIYTLAGQLDVRDRVGRDLIFAGPVLRVHPTVRFGDTRSGIISLGVSTEIDSEVTIPGSILP